MLQNRFQPIDADGLSQKADSLKEDGDSLALPADPRKDRTPYRALIAMNRFSEDDRDDLHRHITAMRRMSRRFARMLPVVRRLQPFQK